MTWRKIHIDEEVWEYQLGKGNAVIKSSDNKKTVVDYSKLTGRSWGIIERGQRKKTSDGMVTPKHIKEYIQKYLSK